MLQYRSISFSYVSSEDSYDFVITFMNLLFFQTEKAFQKQPSIFLNKKRLLGQKVKKNELRFVKNVGLGFRTPKEVLTGTLCVNLDSLLVKSTCMDHFYQHSPGFEFIYLFIYLLLLLLLLLLLITLTCK